MLKKKKKKTQHIKLTNKTHKYEHSCKHNNELFLIGSRLFLFLLLFLSLWVVTWDLLLDLLQNALLLLHIAFLMSGWLRSGILCNRRRMRRWDLFRLLVMARKFSLNLSKEALLFFSLSWLCRWCLWDWEFLNYYLFFVPLNWDAGVLVLFLFVFLLFELLLFFLVSSTYLLLDFILQSLLFLPFLLLLFSFTFLLIARLQFSNNPKFNYKLF